MGAWGRREEGDPSILKKKTTAEKGGDVFWRRGAKGENQTADWRERSRPRAQKKNCRVSKGEAKRAASPPLRGGKDRLRKRDTLHASKKRLC